MAWLPGEVTPLDARSVLRTRVGEGPFPDEPAEVVGTVARLFGGTVKGERFVEHGEELLLCEACGAPERLGFVLQAPLEELICLLVQAANQG